LLIVFTPKRRADAMEFVVGLTLRVAPDGLLVWLDRRRAPLGKRVGALAWREGMRRWRSGRRTRDEFIPF
jgi:hypothetical protein